MSTVLQGQDTVIQADLYMSFELGDKKWMLTLSDGRHGPGRYTVDAGDTAAVADCIRKAKERCRLEPQAKVHTAATKPGATAGGCTAGCSSRASTTSWSTPPASR